MANTTKRLLSFAVALIMVLSLIPVTQLEAKAAETNTVTATTAYWGKNSSDNWQIFESSKAVDLNKVNEKLVPVGEVAADGTMTAYCEVCGGNRTWKAITDSAMPILREAAYDNSHYYLKESITATKGNAPSTDPSLAEGSDFKQSYFWLWIMNRNTCLHLNGFDLTLNVSNNRGYIYHNQHMLNIMGEGTITGNGNYAEMNRGAAITANCNDATNFSIVNLFGGTYKSSTDLPAVAAPGTSSRIDIYPGATVEGLSAAKGKVNVRGGTVTGKVDVAEGTLNVQSGTVNMTDGAITKPVTVSGGKLNMSGGSITAASTQTVLVSSGEFNLSGGTVNGRVFASSLWNQSKLAYVPGVVNMTGGTINGLGTKEDTFAITSYGGGAMFAANGGILNISGGTVNGGWLPDATNSYASAIYITAAGETTTVGENTYKTGVTQLNISGDAVIRGQGYYDENGNVLPEEQQQKVGMTGTIQIYGVHWNNAALWPAGDGAKLTMTGGTIYGSYSNNGAAIQAAPGVVEITGGTIYGGKATNAGGTMQISGYNSAAAPETSYAIIKNATIIGGTAGGDGGSLAIYSTNAVIENSTIDGGISTKTNDTGYNGGGNMHVTGQSVVTVKNTEIKNGKAINGGNLLVNGGATLNLNEGTEVKDGYASGWSGCGALNLSTGTVNINGAYIHDNSSYKEENRGAEKQIGVFWAGTLNVNSGIIADQDDTAMSIYASGWLDGQTERRVYVNINGGTVGTVFYPDAYSNYTINDGAIYGWMLPVVTAQNTVVKHGEFHYPEYSESQLALLAEGAEPVIKDGVLYVHNRGAQAGHQDSTCTEAGYTSYTCTTCEAVYTPVTTAAKEHDYSGENGVCVNGCGKIVCENEGHNWGEEVVAKDATCIATGNEAYYYCDVCEQYAQKVEDEYVITAWNEIELPINPENHSGEAVLDEESVVAPSCGVDGYTGDYVCPGCDKIITEGETDPATGNHTVSYKDITEEQHTAYCGECEKWSETVAHTFVEGVCACGQIEKVEEEDKGEATINGVAYETLQKALDAAQSGEVVVLSENLTVNETFVTVKDGVTLDLNGKTLTTDGYIVAAFNGSFITDNSADNSGRLEVSMDKLRLLKNNSQLPVQMADGIMFVDVENGHCWSETYSCYQSWIENMDQALVDALKAESAEDLGLKFQVVLSWDNGKLIHTFTQNTVDGYMVNWETMAMNLTVTGGEGIGQISYQARIVFAEDTAAEVVLWASEAVER